LTTRSFINRLNIRRPASSRKPRVSWPSSCPIPKRPNPSRRKSPSQVSRFVLFISLFCSIFL
jgi:hypothetical protein